MIKRFRTTHEFREKERARAKAKYDRLKAEGICTRCGVEKPEEGKSSCTACLAVYRTGRQMGVGAYKRYPPGCFLYKLVLASGLTVTRIEAATGIPSEVVYQWRTRKPTKDEALRLKTYLIGQ